MPHIAFVENVKRSAFISRIFVRWVLRLSAFSNKSGEMSFRWRNPYTQHMLLQYFEPTGLVTQLPDAYNYKPYWCASTPCPHSRRDACSPHVIRTAAVVPCNNCGHR